VSLHSEGAALLLVWAANLIKLYACNKKLGDHTQTESAVASGTHILNIEEV
jgi:hypothetical protein